MIKVRLPDGAIKEVKKGTSALDIATSISEGLARNVLSASYNDQVVEADLYAYHEGKHMDVILNTVRIRLVWQGRFYVGNMTGYEFTAPEPRKVVFKQHR